MSLAASLHPGALEYAATTLDGLFAQHSNLLRPRFWSMLRDLLRFYREAPHDAHRMVNKGETLGDYLAGRPGDRGPISFTVSRKISRLVMCLTGQEIAQ